MAPSARRQPASPGLAALLRAAPQGSGAPTRSAGGWLRWAALLALLALAPAVVSACMPASSLAAGQIGLRSLVGSLLPPASAPASEPAQMLQVEAVAGEPATAEAVGALATVTSPPSPTPLLTDTPVPSATPLPSATPAPTDTQAPTSTPLPTSTPPPPATPLPTEPPPAAPAAPPPPADRPPTRIVAPAIGLDVPVVEMGWTVVRIGDVEATGWVVPSHAAGFHQGSAYPGRVGNTVISGHSNTGGEVFRYLADLSLGAAITVYVGDTPYQYSLAQQEILREQGASIEERRENGRWIAPTGDERLTLVTCWPYPASTHRLILIARPAR